MGLVAGPTWQAWSYDCSASGRVQLQSVTMAPAGMDTPFRSASTGTYAPTGKATGRGTHCVSPTRLRAFML